MGIINQRFCKSCNPTDKHLTGLCVWCEALGSDKFKESEKVNRCNECRYPVEGKDSLCEVCDINKEEREISKQRAKEIHDGFMQPTVDNPFGELLGSEVGTCIKTTGLYTCNKCKVELEGPFMPCFKCNPMPKLTKENTTYAKPLTGNTKYHVEILPDVWVDVYDVIGGFKVTDAGLQHALKKILVVGKRGHKDEAEDRKDIHDSVVRSNERFELFNNGEK